MNRRTSVISIAIAAIAVFLAGSYLYGNFGNNSGFSESDGAPLERPHAPTFGPDDAPVTVVEFFDPACEACRAFHPFVKQLVTETQGQVRVVLRYAAFHQPSEDAIRILEAARLQGKFETVLERLLETQPRWAPHGRPPEDIWQFLAGTGLDIEKARLESRLPDIQTVLNQDAADIQTVGVKRTPTFFVNGKPLTDFGIKQLFEMVGDEIVRTRAEADKS